MIESIAFGIAIILTIKYCIEVLTWTEAWLERPKTTQIKAKNKVSVSVVIALHNEEHNVKSLMASLSEQICLPAELIFVSDHSTDNTIAALEKEAHNYKGKWKIVDNTSEMGKKHAQRLGVSIATSQYVIVTDADCQVSPQWVQTMTQSIVDSGSSLIIAPVTMRANSNTLLQRLMEMEFLAMQAVGAATALLKHPTMCNGANLAFRRSMYMSHNQHNEYISGDDMFLLSEAKHQRELITYTTMPQSLVVTHCPANLTEYYKQRTRWLRKSSGYTDADIKRLSLIVFIGNAVWPIAFFFSPLCSLICFGLKTVSEMALLKATHSHWQVSFNVLVVLCMAIVYPFNLLAITLFTFFRNKRNW